MGSPGLRVRFLALVEPLGQVSLQRELVMVLLILAESMIVFIYGGTLLAETDSPYRPLPASIIFAVLLIAYLIPHLLETLRIWSPEYEFIMSAGLIGTMLAVIKLGAFPEADLFSNGWIEGAVQALILRESEAIRPLWPLIALTAYAWARGRTRAEPVLETGYSMLRLGLIWAAGGLLLGVLAMPSDAALFGSITPAVAGFMVFSLLAIAVSRHHPARSRPTRRRIWIWSVLVILPVLVIGASTLSVSGVLTRETLELVLTIISPILWTAGMLAQAIVLIIAILAFIIISPVIWLLERQGLASFSGFPRFDLARNGQGDLDDFAQSTLEIADPIRYVIAGVVLFGIGWALVRFAFRRRRDWSGAHRQQRESLIEWQAIPSHLLRRATRWLRRGSGTVSGYPYPSGSQWEGNRRVRRAYRAFLQVTRRHDLTRDPADTPGYFAVRVCGRYDELRPEIDEITEAYNQARYSGKPVPIAAAENAENAGNRFERSLGSMPDDARYNG